MENTNDHLTIHDIIPILSEMSCLSSVTFMNLIMSCKSIYREYKETIPDQRNKHPGAYNSLKESNGSGDIYSRGYKSRDGNYIGLQETFAPSIRSYGWTRHTKRERIRTQGCHVRQEDIPYVINSFVAWKDIDVSYLRRK